MFVCVCVCVYLKSNYGSCFICLSSGLDIASLGKDKFSMFECSRLQMFSIWGHIFFSVSVS
jgi:hypothetical protein